MRGLVAGALCVGAALAAGTGCVIYDRDALFQKMIVECRISFTTPRCAQDEESLNAAFDDGLPRFVNSWTEQACLLDAECSDDPDANAAAILGCHEPTNNVGLPGGTCRSECDVELGLCGGTEACDVATVHRCYDRFDACRDWCGMTLDTGHARDQEAVDIVAARP